MTTLNNTGGLNRAGQTTLPSNSKEGDNTHEAPYSEGDALTSGAFTPLTQLSSFEQFSRQPTTLEMLSQELSNTGPDSNVGADSNVSLLHSRSGHQGSADSWGAVPTYIQQTTTSDPSSSVRRDQIDSWLESNALARDILDAAGGERVADAFRGDSDLGTLNAEETRYLAQEALTIWQADGNTENVSEAASGIDSNETREIIASVYSQPSVQRFEVAQANGTRPAELSDIDRTALRTAIGIDATAVIYAHEGHEGALGSALGDQQDYQGRNARERVLNAVSGPGIDAQDEGISQMVTAIFLKSNASDYNIASYSQATADALTNISIDESQFQAEPAGSYDRAVDAASTRFYNVLTSHHGSRSFIANENVSPELRGWAVASIATDPQFNVDNLRNGWQSDLVSTVAATPVNQQYLDRGIEPQTLQGEALRNTIGQALGIEPDLVPDSFATPEEEQAFLDAGLNNQYYSDNAHIDAIADRIAELGGPNAEVSIMPVNVTSNEFGSHTFSVFKVEGNGETFYIEDINPSRHYEGFDDWKENSQLPPGKMTYAEGLDWNDGNATLVTENTTSVTDSFGEWARKIGDGAALVIGIGVGAAVILGSGGTALLVAGAGAGLYSTARAGEQLHDAHTHGQDVSDLSDAEIRSLWLDAAAGSLSFGAMGAAHGATKLLSTGSRFAQGATTTAAGLQLSANVADVASGTNQIAGLASQWDSLSTSERAMGLLNAAFWAGSTAKSAHTNGGFVADDYSFSRLRNTIEFGTPFAQVRNSDMQEGEIRVAYDVGANGRATNVRIEMGGAGTNSDLLGLHVQAARQMEASGGLRDQLSSIVGGYRPLPVGSAGWEARQEINKIEAEQALVREDLSNNVVNQTVRAEQQYRLDELDNAIAHQRERLDQLALQGEGWVASPSRGQQQADANGYPALEDGYVWVARADGNPTIRRSDTSLERKVYDAQLREIVSAPDVRMERVGHGENELEWTTNANNEPIQVTGTLREFHRNAERSSAELDDQNAVRDRGLPDDHAGHVVGHRFVLDQGLKNMFPQDANFNTSAYKTLENEMADWIAVGADVHVDIQLSGYIDGRPTTVDVSYRVTHPDLVAPDFAKREIFGNNANQVYNRIASDDIRALVGQ